MNYKIILCILASLVAVACGSRSGKSDAALIKSLSRATIVLAEKNEQHFKKLETKYLSDTSNPELKTLYRQFSAISQYKKEYEAVVFEAGDKELGEANKKFVENCFTQLDEEEKVKIGKMFDESLIMNAGFMKEVERREVLAYELMLEAETMEREMQLLILKDLNVRKPGFKWEYYWE